MSVIICIVLAVILGESSANINHHLILKKLRQLNSKTPSKYQLNAVLELINRTLPTHAEQFEVDLNQKYFDHHGDIDGFQIESTMDGKILITGTSGVAASAGFYHYIKYWCKGHISWSGNQLNIPDTLPKVETPFRKTFMDK